MSGRFLAALIAALTVWCGPASAQPLPEGAPLEEFFDQCEGKDGWNDPAPPIRLFSNVYHVGTCGIVVLLIIGDEGSVLIDSGPADAAPQVAANLDRLGSVLTDVRGSFPQTDVAVILTSHEHHDHVGGVAELQRMTGATVLAREAAMRALEKGTFDPADPQFALGNSFPAVANVRLIGDGRKVKVGNLELTMHSTPGHAPGSTSWSWRSCEGETCHTVAYVDSVTPVSAGSYRFSDHSETVTAFARSFDTIAAIDCDLIITPHPSASQLYEKLAGDAPLADSGACRNYAAWGKEQLETRLAREAGGE